MLLRLLGTLDRPDCAFPSSRSKSIASTMRSANRHLALMGSAFKGRRTRSHRPDLARYEFRRTNTPLVTCLTAMSAECRMASAIDSIRHPNMGKFTGTSALLESMGPTPGGHEKLQQSDHSDLSTANLLDFFPVV